MIGSRVFHTVFGGGVITGKTGTLLTVDFGGDEKKFVYPDVFEKYLESADQELMSQVNSNLQIKRNAHAQAIPSVIQSSSTTPQSRIKKRRKKIEWSNVAFKCNYCDGGKHRPALDLMASVRILYYGTT